LLFAVALALALAGACGGRSTDGVTFEERELTRAVDDCAPGAEGCAWVRLRWIETTGGPEAVTSAVDEWIRAHLLEPLGDHWTVRSPEDVAASLLTDRADFLRDFPDAATGDWYLEREVRRLPAPAEVVSLEFVERQYTGGAHGLETIRLASFDAATGAILGLGDLVPADRRDAFFVAAERAFRKHRGLTADEDLREAGFFVEQNALPPTDNVALVQDGIRLHYDAYEIGPYAMGPTDLTVPR